MTLKHLFSHKEYKIVPLRNVLAYFGILISNKKKNVINVILIAQGAILLLHRFFN